MIDLVLDSNALSRWSQNDRDLLALMEAVQQANGVVHVPTVCLVESLTGTAADAEVNRRLKGARSVPLDDELARSAAGLRAAVDGDDAADAVVVATADRLDAVVVSDDPDIRVLATHVTPPVRVA